MWRNKYIYIYIKYIYIYIKTTQRDTEEELGARAGWSGVMGERRGKGEEGEPGWGAVM